MTISQNNPTQIPPDWHDVGRRVRLIKENGDVVFGRIEYEDTTPGPDESPICFARSDDGIKHELDDFVSGSYLEK